MQSGRINTNKPLFYVFCLVSAVIFVTVVFLSFPSPACAYLSLLKAPIVAYNIECHKKSLSDGSYRGEEGILRIRPEIARSFGLKTLMNQEYLEARELFKTVDRLLEDIVESMTTQEKERFQGEHVKMIAETALLYKSTLRSAREKMMVYRSNLTPGIDERLDRVISLSLLDRLLKESLTRASGNLRGALGYLYNVCHDFNENGAPLNPKNVRFVNYVFHEFTKKASDKTMKGLDLDRHCIISPPKLDPQWKFAMGRSAARYIATLESVIGELKNPGYPVDLFLFLALIRQESNFKPHSVSQVGAVGLTQIMPGTAKGLGMKNIFRPAYFDEAGAFMRSERNMRRRAMALVLGITEASRLETAKRARQLMQESLDLARKRKKLYARYRRELLKNGADDRLDPYKAIKYGFKYFAMMMRKQKGDISLALASYNAGPHRVKQYNGIPPYAETISFRNRVLRYYREYLGMVEKYRVGGPELH